MEGRRVSRKSRRNPLYVIFMGLLAAVVVLLIAVIVLGVKLKGANRELADAQEKLEQLQSGGTQQGGDDLLADDDPAGNDAQQSGAQGELPSVSDDQPDDTQQPAANDDVIDWLDLTGHSEVQQKPKSVYDKYYVYYTTDGVNLRAGPSTSYDKVKLLDLGTEVKAAAKQDGWTFVSAGGKFGWINSDYLSTTRPEPRTTSAATSTSSAAASTGSSATSSASGAASTTVPSTPTAPESDTSGEMPEWLKVG